MERELTQEEFNSKITPGNVAHVITQYAIEEGSGRTPAQQLFEDLNSYYSPLNIYKSLEFIDVISTFFKLIIAEYVKYCK